jgi:hypothetical protein
MDCPPNRHPDTHSKTRLVRADSLPSRYGTSEQELVRLWDKGGTIAYKWQAEGETPTNDGVFYTEGLEIFPTRQ